MSGRASHWSGAWPSLTLLAACQAPPVASPVEEAASGSVPLIVAVPYDHVDHSLGQYVHAEIPQCRGDRGTHAAGFDHLLRTIVFERVDEFRSACGTAGSLNITMEVVGPFGGVVSVLLHSTAFTGGFRPDHETIVVNYDWVDGRMMRLADLFQLGANIGTLLGIEEEWWYLAAEELVVEIPAGVADCYAAGPVFQRVPVEHFSGLLSRLGRRVWGNQRSAHRSR